MASDQLHRIEPSESDLTRNLLFAIIENDRQRYDALSASSNLAYNQPLRVTVIAIAGWMTGMALYKKRFLRRLPSREKREEIIDTLIASDFGDLVDRSVALHRFSVACDRDESAPSRSVESMNTTLILCAALFRSELKDWARCYRTWSKQLGRRLGVREAFRQSF
jgi:hypothetical protein